ncbi:spore germination protein [Paenibacillus chartarius]|uniref:Spore germination protein n=1 Tax=Paenibacillus chartarius TaxID=747481 RepID=A0ABV6DKX2_9BACL
MRQKGRTPGLLTRMLHERRHPSSDEGESGVRAESGVPSGEPGTASHVTHIRFLDDLKREPLFASLAENRQALKHFFQDCSDIVVRDIEFEAGIPGLIAFTDGLVNSAVQHEALEAMLVFEGVSTDIETFMHANLPVGQVAAKDNFGEVLLGILGGDTAVFVGDQSKAVLLSIRGPEKRSISEPDTEAVVRGPKEGFVESLRTNTSLIRRKLKTPRLKMKSMVIGKETNTSIVVSYLEDIAVPSTVEEVIKRIKKINIDGVLESGYIEEFIQDNSYSPFPQVQYTERPDVVAAALLQGRVAIIVDGTPFVLLVPFVFAQIMQASEDYYERFQIATLIRWLRYLFLVLSVTTPAFYVAVMTFHQDLLPTTLLLTIAAARENIPFPAVVEALIMEVTFEALREAGIRLPKTIGSAVSILGALVIGQSAVQAGIVSAPMVIVVSITGIASFTIPKFNGAIALRMLRFPILLVASVFGFYGILLCAILIVGHLAGLRSFGIPYLSPLGPLSAADLSDTLVRAPWWTMDKRPQFMPVQDNVRLDTELPDEIAEQSGQEGRNIDHKEDDS